ncbi:MAG: hypothetical protein F6K42_28740, partial [Leptolyngbya sp. SIO1D8]|nr:hypothetical protein [Leptolyngbya sp. SIO1D8]
MNVSHVQNGSYTVTSDPDGGAQDSCCQGHIQWDRLIARIALHIRQLLDLRELQQMT